MFYPDGIQLTLFTAGELEADDTLRLEWSNAGPEIKAFAVWTQVKRRWWQFWKPKYENKLVSLRVQ